MLQRLDARLGRLMKEELELELPTPKNVGLPMPIYVSGLKEYGTALKAMRNHGSQMVWFRWGYVLFSRYMWVNEWEEVVLRP